MSLSTFSIPQGIADVVSRLLPVRVTTFRGIRYLYISAHVFLCFMYYYCVVLFTDRSVTKFRDALLGTAVRISSIDIDKRYPVLHAERLETKYGTSVILTIRESSGNVISVLDA